MVCVKLLDCLVTVIVCPVPSVPLDADNVLFACIVAGGGFLLLAARCQRQQHQYGAQKCGDLFHFVVLHFRSWFPDGGSHAGRATKKAAQKRLYVEHA